MQLDLAAFWSAACSPVAASLRVRRKRETLTGDATIRYFDYLEDFGQFGGLLPNLFTEISTSKERSFSCVDFVDTPGLVDGDMKVCTVLSAASSPAVRVCQVMQRSCSGISITGSLVLDTSGAATLLVSLQLLATTCRSLRQLMLQRPV